MKRNRLSERSAVLLALVLAISGCDGGGGGGGEGRKNGESAQNKKKSPFATDNVSVAPQVEGRAPAPTPVEVPKP